MIELVTTVIITVSSVLLFGYWFRYTCLLILSAKTTRDFAGQVAAANQLGFLEVQAQLRAKLSDNLDSLARHPRSRLRRAEPTAEAGERFFAEGSSLEKQHAGDELHA